MYNLPPLEVGMIEVGQATHVQVNFKEKLESLRFRVHVKRRDQCVVLTMWVGNGRR